MPGALATGVGDADGILADFSPEQPTKAKQMQDNIEMMIDLIRRPA
ncbi:MAG: hypothetical protein ABIU09_05095 [Pyrinomonadaceae bacterium]